MKMCALPRKLGKAVATRGKEVKGKGAVPGQQLDETTQKYQGNERQSWERRRRQRQTDNS